jgi:proton-dependent oligopeptide transporter, POT family
MKLLNMASKKCWTASPITTYRNFKREGFWDVVKPSHLGSAAPAWMQDIDDNWVDQVARGFNACKVFLWLP